VLLSFGHTGTVAVWSLHIELVTVVLLAERQFGYRHWVETLLPVQMACWRGLSVGHGELGLGHGHLDPAFGRTHP